MDTFRIVGGKPISGTVRVSGAKNVALKVVAAGLMTADELVLRNMPDLTDVRTMLEILQVFGSKTSFEEGIVKITTPQITSSHEPLELGAKCKTGTITFGPLLNLTGEAIIPNPGGCRIGARPIDRYIQGLEAMGAVIDYEDGYFKAKAPGGLRGTRFRFHKNSHTGTETLVLAAVMAKGSTVIENAALEPEVDDLIGLLNAMGAKIRRQAEREIHVEGVDSLHGADYSIMGDPLEAATFGCLALATAGDVTITGVRSEHMRYFTENVIKAGRSVDELPDGVRVYGTSKMKAVEVTTTIYPGFRTDWQQPWCVVMTQAEGVSMIHETIFENRFAYAEQLQKMGAVIELYRPDVADPDLVYNFNLDNDRAEYMHAAKIIGPTPLHGAEVDVTDLRAGATLVIAALAADGTSIIRGIHHIERGYEQFLQRIKLLGADITLDAILT